MPPAPGRFSITTGWPSVSASRCEKLRAAKSAMPPGANATMTRTGFDGNGWAHTGATGNKYRIRTINDLAIAQSPTVQISPRSCQTPDARRQTPDARCQTPDARCQMPDARRFNNLTSDDWRLTTGVLF